MATNPEPPHEQTVLEAIYAGIASKRSWFKILESMGLDVDMPVSTLRERLAIAERALTVKAPSDTWDGSPESLNYDTGWDDCLRAIWGDAGDRGLRGGQTP